MNNNLPGMFSDMPETNRKYKDTVFRKLFGDKGRLLELYNAINGTAHANPDELEIVTLENAIYMNMKNDLAFLMAFSLNIYEHQSTNNPNMPLRDLVYVAKEYQKLIDTKKFYSTKKIYIPAPRFVMLYNGTEDLPDKFELKLSDLYNPAVMEPELELKVTVYNINYGHNQGLMEQCRSLKEYAMYVDKVRSFKKDMSVREAVICAVEECINQGILKVFLIAQRKEVIAMSIYEYDEEAVLAMLADEYREDGIELGKAQGIEIGKAEGIEQGRAEGKAEGEDRMLRLVSKMMEAGESDKIKLLSENKEFLEAMRSKYLGKR